MRVATHSGPFHADDVLAWALLRTFLTDDLELVRSRDKAVLAEADIVFDVGGVFDPASGRFDHHQSTYTGPLSSAGMVLTWLEDQGHVDTGMAAALRHQLVDYVDAVDNGRIAPDSAVPCFPRIVESLTQQPSTNPEFDAAFVHAGELAHTYVAGILAGVRRIREAEAVVTAAMADAVAAGRRTIFLDAYCKWKEPYFAHGGADHPTEFVLHPGNDNGWRVMAIPPKLGDFGQKRSFPQEWAGLSDEELEAVTGVPGSVFCHKNRFIAVFRTRDAALEAMRRYDLL